MNKFLKLLLKTKDNFQQQGGEKMLYNANDIAHYIVSECYKKHKPVSNLKLQKMLYFAWIDYYKKTSSSLFLDNICAWQLGPVVPDVYYEYCSYGGRPICETNWTIISNSDSKILDEIIDKYIDIPASVLVNETHAKGSAWDIIFNGGNGNRGIIPFTLIKERECWR